IYFCPNRQWPSRGSSKNRLMKNAWDIGIIFGRHVMWRWRDNIIGRRFFPFYSQFYKTVFQRCKFVLPMAAQVSAARAEHQITGISIAGDIHEIPPRGNGVALISDGVVERADVFGANKQPVAHGGGNSL